MKIALDTNRYSDLDRNIPGVATLIAAADEVHVPFVVLAELHIGFRRGSKQIEHGLTLYARDKHFDHLPQLARV